MEPPGKAVNPLKSFTKLGVFIEEFIIDFKQAAPVATVIELTMTPMTDIFSRQMVGCL